MAVSKNEKSAKGPAPSAKGHDPFAERRVPFYDLSLHEMEWGFYVQLLPGSRNDPYNSVRLKLSGLFRDTILREERGNKKSCTEEEL